MKQYTIHIPVADNNEVEFPLEVHIGVSVRACKLFSGYTFDNNKVIGEWVNEKGEHFLENMFRLHIASDDIEEVKSFVRELKVIYNQQAMYMVESGDVNFI